MTTRICDLIFEKGHFPQNNLLIFNHSPFHCFVQEVNEIWYSKRAIIKHLIVLDNNFSIKIYPIRSP